ncbi:hypothetical protein AOLI_G00056960 [Acnodon oligacanthus]
MLASACQAAAARRRVGRGASPPRDKEEDGKNEREEKEGTCVPSKALAASAGLAVLLDERFGVWSEASGVGEDGWGTWRSNSIILLECGVKCLQISHVE